MDALEGELFSHRQKRCDISIAAKRYSICTLHNVKTIVWARPGISIVILIVLSICEDRYSYPNRFFTFLITGCTQHTISGHISRWHVHNKKKGKVGKSRSGRFAPGGYTGGYPGGYTGGYTGRYIGGYDGGGEFWGHEASSAKHPNQWFCFQISIQSVWNTSSKTKMFWLTKAWKYEEYEYKCIWKYLIWENMRKS